MIPLIFTTQILGERVAAFEPLRATGTGVARNRVIVNIILFHLFLAPSGIPVATVVLLLELFLAWRYRQRVSSHAGV